MLKLFERKLIFLILLSPLFADEMVITKDGKEVILKPDKTWEFKKTLKPTEPATKTQNAPLKEYFKSPEAVSELKASKMNFSIWYNPARVKQTEFKSNPNIKYAFALKENFGFAMVIPEPLTMTPEMMTQIALESAQKVDPDAKLENLEYRIINKKKILHLTYNAKVHKNDFVYHSYIYIREKISQFNSSSIQRKPNFRKPNLSFLNC